MTGGRETLERDSLHEKLARQPGTGADRLTVVPGTEAAKLVEQPDP